MSPSLEGPRGAPVLAIVPAGTGVVRVAIMLPGWLETAVDLIGFNWPDVDEDDLRTMASGLRDLGHSLTTDGSDTLAKLQSLNSTVKADSYAALVEHWAGHSHQHITELAEVCGLMSTGIDVAADAVVAIKLQIIAALTVLAEEIATALAASFVTFGLSDLADGPAAALCERVCAGLINRLEAEVLGKLAGEVFGGLQIRMEQAIDHLVYEGVAKALA